MELWKCARWRLAASRPARYGTAVLTVATVIAALNQLWIASVNPWILVTAPLNAAHAGNSIIGYSSRSAAVWAAALTAVGSGSLVHLNDLSGPHARLCELCRRDLPPVRLESVV
jgi:hypothetical protein